MNYLWPIFIKKNSRRYVYIRSIFRFLIIFNHLNYWFLVDDVFSELCVLLDIWCNKRVVKRKKRKERIRASLILSSLKNKKLRYFYIGAFYFDYPGKSPPSPPSLSFFVFSLSVFSLLKR